MSRIRANVLLVTLNLSSVLIATSSLAAPTKTNTVRLRNLLVEASRGSRGRIEAGGERTNCLSPLSSRASRASPVQTYCIATKTEFPEVTKPLDETLFDLANISSTSITKLNLSTPDEVLVKQLHSTQQTSLSSSTHSSRLAQILSQVEPYSSDDSPSSPLRMVDDLNSDHSSEPDAMAQVTSVSQLTDIQPTDWAFKALQSLVKRYGCIQGYPNKTYRGNRAITRYEFAAGVNACNDRINELIATSTTDLVRNVDLLALQKLQQEFATELATLRSRVDAVEASTAQLEQQQFSTTTKFNAEAVFAVANVFGQDSDKNNTVLQERAYLNFVTSFTGKDQLVTTLAVGNTPQNITAFNLPGVKLGGELPVSTAEGTLTHQSGGNLNNSFYLYALEYRFPVGDRATAILEGYAGVTYYIAQTFNPYLDYLDYGKGAISAFGQRSPIYRLGAGPGIGLNYKLTDTLTLTGVYLSDSFAANNPSPGRGFFQGGYTALGQLGWNPTKNFGIGLTYVNNYFRPGDFGFNNYGGLQVTGTAVANTLSGQTNLFLISQPEQPVAMNSYGVELSDQLSPKFAIGGWFGASYTRLIGRGDGEILYYALTLAFPDFGKKGSLLGFVVGAEPYLTHFNGGNPQPFKTDIPLHVEAFYQYQVTPGIALTPGLIWLTAPNQDNSNGSDVIATLRTTFTF